MTPLDRDTDMRLRAIEQWKPAIDRRVENVRRELVGVRMEMAANTATTNDTNEKVTEMWTYFSAGKVNTRILVVLLAILGGVGGCLAGVVAWIHR